MGRLTYDSTLTADFDDWVLAHLQVVIGAKLRRGEAFYFTWRNDPEVGGGRNTIWMHPALPLGFKFHEASTHPLNVAWIEALMATANSTGGLRIVPEPDNKAAKASD